MSTDAAAPSPLPGLPGGLSVRPLSLSDARDVHGLLAADELETVGFVEIEVADVVADWQRPWWNASTSTVGVFVGPPHEPVLVAYAEVDGHEHGCAVVAAEHRGRGIGGALAHWMQHTARAQGMAGVGMSVPQGSPGDLLLEALGYDVRWESWSLELPPGASVPDRPLPDGCTVRSAREDEREAVWTVNEDAFTEWALRERLPYDEWLATVVERPGFEPWQLRVVVDADDAVLGMALLHVGDRGDEPSAHVAKLATRADRRGRGLGQALLADAFRAATARGAARCTLSTDSRTSALGLYERVGMRVVSTWVHRDIRF